MSDCGVCINLRDDEGCPTCSLISQKVKLYQKINELEKENKFLTKTIVTLTDAAKLTKKLVTKLENKINDIMERLS